MSSLSSTIVYSVKFYLRGEIIRYSSVGKYNQFEHDVFVKIANLNNVFKKNNTEYIEQSHKLAEIDDTIENLGNKKIEVCILRPKTRWYVAGEKSTSFIINIEKLY